MRALPILALALLAGAAAPPPAPVAPAQVVATFPHDPRAFTEGLLYHDGSLYESTGEPGRSSIRQVELATGRVLRSVAIAAPTFGEGIVIWGRQIVSLTWQGGIGWRWRLADFMKQGEFHYPGEGWALTHDGRSIVMSDGTAQLRFLDPATLRERRRLTVTADGRPVDQLNELEYVDGEILANIWRTNRIARIDPASGRVVGWIDVSALTAQVRATDQDDVPNGIAWDARGRRLFVTGKDWPVLFQIRPPKG
ncbi:glutaminyl-peptide cyclotransferase [Sphingomonas bacterium]|uniref:glutaminyl-peptide cyclotransferase n=1 Tax=Sphingomonas bacterium TaxID=1895847 RepID=UPI00157759B8|nr:glutaminyl-peptide cyclotransferase [Sphingomonas bacterium]